MRLTGMTTWRLAVDSAAYFGPSAALETGSQPPVWEYFLTRLDTAEGIEGFTMGFPMWEKGEANARLLHEVYWSHLRGANPLRHEAIWQQLFRLNRHVYALSDVMLGVLDVALWDIRGKAAGQSIAQLLGQYRDKVPSYGSISQQIATPEQTAAEVRRVQAEGYQGCKIQVWDGPTRDIPRLEAAREAAGPDFRLMHDASGMYTYIQAIEVGRALDRLNYHWYEEPVPDRQIGMLRRLADELATPILAAETVRLAELPEFIRQSAIDIVRGDVYLKAGITGLRKALGMCELFGYNLEPHTGSTPLLDVANLQVACTTPLCEFLELHHEVFRFGLKDSPLTVDTEGYVHLPQGPGLGVELDWDWIDNNTLEVIRSE